MIKSKLLLLLLLLFPALVQADPVTREQARSNAISFVKERVSKGARKAPAAGKTMRLTDAAANPSYYAFNVEGGGFVLVSASDRTQSILGYTDDGTFNLDNAPEAFKAWIARLSEVIQAADAGTISSTSRNAGPRKVAHTVTKNVIPTLVASRWNQGDPYNQQVPMYTDKDGKQQRAATGCVATAMSQIMYFWKWPKTATPEIPGYTTGWNNTTTTYGPLPSTTFDWDNMTDTYDSNSSQKSKDAVANLMHYVGKSIHMGYGPSSGAVSGNCPRALKNYYGYDKNCYLASSDDYTYQEWEDLIYSELAAGRPLLMAGDTSDRTGGHEWVCDGYDGNGCFHMNWGWGGMCDGYFLLTVMFPDQQGIGGSTSSDGYSMGQNIVVGLKPAVDDTPADPEVVRINISNIRLDKTTYTRKTTSGNFTFPISYSAGTSLENAYNFDAAFTLYDNNGNIIKDEIGKESNFVINPGTYWPTRTIRVLFGKDLPDGTYFIKGRSRQNGTTEWNEDKLFDKHYIKAVISDGTNLTLTVYPAVNLTVNSLSLIGQGAGSENKVKANITNNEESEYYRDTYLIADGQWVSGNCIVIPGLSTNDYYFKYTPASAGEHKLALSTSKNPSDAFYTTTVNVKEQATPDLTIRMKSLTNASGGNIYGNSIRLQVTVTNNSTKPYQNYIEASPWEVSGGYYWKRSSSRQDVNIAPGETATLFYQFDNLNYGSRYNFHTDSNGGPSANLGDFTFNQGILYWKADGIQTGVEPVNGFKVTADMVAVSIPGKTPKSFSVDDDANTNTLFYFEDGATISSRMITVLNKRGFYNFVKGSKADKIVIDDAHDFYLPRSIEAKEISYKRSVPADASKAPWTTLALPFEPQTLTVDDAPADWFHSATDAGKSLIIEEFTAAEGSTLYFDFVDRILANRPYIMAVAGKVGDSSFDLSGKTITLSATDAVLETVERISTYSTDYKYVGTTVKCTPEKAYTLSDGGRSFMPLAANGTVNPFRAYIVPNNDIAAAVQSLVIANNALTSIDKVTADAIAEGSVIYTVAGVKVGVLNTAADLQRLPKGIYVVGGRKFVVK